MGKSWTQHRFGYVVFATPEAAQIAVSAKGTIYVRDRLVDVQMPGEQSTNSYSSEAVVTVFVGALPRGCLDEEFEVAESGRQAERSC